MNRKFYNIGFIILLFLNLACCIYIFINNNHINLDSWIANIISLVTLLFSFVEFSITSKKDRPRLYLEPINKLNEDKFSINIKNVSQVNAVNIKLILQFNQLKKLIKLMNKYGYDMSLLNGYIVIKESTSQNLLAIFRYIRTSSKISVLDGNMSQKVLLPEVYSYTLNKIFKVLTMERFNRKELEIPTITFDVKYESVDGVKYTQRFVLNSIVEGACFNEDDSLKDVDMIFGIEEKKKM